MSVKRPKAFTLIELLAVIGIIAILLAIMLPALSRARQYAQAITCRSQLRQIGTAVQMYASSNRGFLEASPSGYQWLATNPQSGQLELIAPQNTNAYWGVAYSLYLLPQNTLHATGNSAQAILQAADRIWRCPSASNLPSPFCPDPTNPATYAVNGFITGSKAPPYRKLAAYTHSSDIIFCHDSIEPEIATTSAESLSNFGSGTNMKYFRPGGTYYVAYQITWGVSEAYRHHNQCNILYLDGHVGSLRLSDGSDVPSTAYQPLYVYGH